MENHIEKLHDICSIVNATPIDNYSTVMEIAAVIARNFFHAQSAYIFVLGEQENLECASHTVQHATGDAADTCPAVELFYEVMKNEMIVWVDENTSSQVRYIETRSLVIPLIANGKSFGVVLINTPSQDFSVDDTDVFIRTTFSVVSSLIFNGILFKEKKKASDTLLIRNSELAESLSAQETLLRELHHRVKNNMQIILSMINLQLQRLNNPEMIQIVRTIEKRIRSISIVHEKMLWKETASSINFNEYIQDIVDDLISVYQTTKDSCKILIEGEILYLSLNQAISCGLIINEAVTNSLKYAFSETWKNPEISIQITSDSDNTIIVRIRDNGRGLKEHFEVRNSNTLGLLLMSALAQQNLKGTITIESQDGVTVSVRFPVDAGCVIPHRNNE